jgi:hypothetical protein
MMMSIMSNYEANNILKAQLKHSNSSSSVDNNIHIHYQ